MTEVFDDYADRYDASVQESISFCKAPHQFFMQAKVDHLLALTRRHIGDPRSLSFLDIGCGIGATDSLLGPSVGRLVGVDTSEQAVLHARSRNSNLAYYHDSGGKPPLDGMYFDVVFAINVTHHVPQADWRGFLERAARLCRPSGLFVVFEHNPWNPLTRKAVDACAFDRDAVLLSRHRLLTLLADMRFSVVEKKYILFFPWKGSFWRGLEIVLAPFPLGAQYYVAVRGV